MLAMPTIPDVNTLGALNSEGQAVDGEGGMHVLNREVLEGTHCWYVLNPFLNAPPAHVTGSTTTSSQSTQQRNIMRGNAARSPSIFPVPFLRGAS